MWPGSISPMAPMRNIWKSSGLWIRLREELGLPIGTMLDTKGPEIRLGVFENGAVMLQPGAHFILTPEQVPGTEERSYITYGGLGRDLRPGSRVLIDDGLIELTVDYITGQGGDPHHSQERRQGFQPQGCQCAGCASDPALPQ